MGRRRVYAVQGAREWRICKRRVSPLLPLMRYDLRPVGEGYALEDIPRATAEEHAFNSRLRIAVELIAQDKSHCHSHLMQTLLDDAARVDR